MPPIQYLSFLGIMATSTCRSCRMSRSFSCHVQNMDPTSSGWVAIKHSPISLKMCTYLSTIQRISVGLQIWIDGGDGAVRAAQSMYWSCHDTIRTRLLHWSQSCRKCKVDIVVQFQPGQRHTVLCAVRVIKPPRHCPSGSWVVPNPD